MIEQFYNDINAKDYCNAYSMWEVAPPNPPSCQEFSKGYQNTVRVDINFDNTQSTLSSDGRVYITLQVTNQVGNSDQQTVYNGWYVVAQVKGVWKIKEGHFS